MPFFIVEKTVSGRLHWTLCCLCIIYGTYAEIIFLRKTLSASKMIMWFFWPWFYICSIFMKDKIVCIFTECLDEVLMGEFSSEYKCSWAFLHLEDIAWLHGCLASSNVSSFYTSVSPAHRIAPERIILKFIASWILNYNSLS